MSTEEKLDLNKLQQDVETEIENDAHGKIARICRTVLSSKPNELLWLRLLCCAMIHLSQTKSLLEFIETYSNKHQIYNALLFYKIYALYLSKQNENAKQLIIKNKQNIESKLPKEEQIAIQYLRFQIFYRLGQYQDALKALNELKDDEQHSNEIAINKISTYIAMNASSRAIKEYYNNTSNDDDKLYTNCDFIFNLSTALIINGQLDDAKSFLLSSLTKCEQAMKAAEEYDDEEITAEIGNLLLLIAYCYHEQGDNEKASEYYQQLTEKQQINGIYQKLILQNNSLAINIKDEPYEEEEEKKINEQIKNKKDKKKQKKSKKGGKQKEEKQETKKKTDPNLLIYKKLLSQKYEDNFSRIGCEEHGISELLKAYHNKCIVLIKGNHETQFKALLGQMKSKYVLSEIPLFLRVSFHLKKEQYQQCKDILFHHLSSNPNASRKSKMMYIQILIITNKYRLAIKQIRLLSNDIRFKPNMINILLTLAKKLNDNALIIEIMKESIDYLQNTKSNQKLLVSLQIKLCRLLIAKNRASEAKSIAQNLYNIDSTNSTYQAMLLLSAIAAEDLSLAEKVSSGIKLDIKYDQFAVDDLLVNIPNIDHDDESKEDINNVDIEEETFSFEINEDIINQRKREMYRRKREKNAIKLRQKYKEHPELYKDPIDWTPKKN